MLTFIISFNNNHAWARKRKTRIRRIRKRARIETEKKKTKRKEIKKEATQVPQAVLTHLILQARQGTEPERNRVR